MTGGSIDRLRMARCRPVASVVVGRAQMRAAFDALSWNFHIGRAGIVTVGRAAAARVLWNAASLRSICLMLWRIPIGRPFQTLPIMSCNPYPLGGNALTGD